MQDVELTKEELLGLSRSLEVANQVSIPVSPALKIAAITRKVDEAKKDFQTAEQSFVEEFAKMEDGEIVYETDEDGRPTQEPVLENTSAFIRKRNDLLDEAIELHVPVFGKKDFDSIKKLVGADDDSEGEEREIPPIVLKAWVMLLDENLNIEDLIN